jgi:hypothetical protein
MKMNQNYTKPGIISEELIQRTLVYAEAVTKDEGCKTWVKNDITNNERVV